MSGEGKTVAVSLPNLDMAIARRQLHMVLLLDVSGSMRGDKIASLNYAMRAAIPEIRAVAEDNPEVDVRVRVLRFSTTAQWHVAEPIPVGALEWQDVIAEGDTAMGEALGMVAGLLTPEAMPGRQLPAVIVLVSDGYPSDDIEAGFAKFFAAPYAGRALRVAVAIGTDADREILERFIDNPKLEPLRANNAQELVNQIKWATTMPVKSVSSPTNAPDPVAVLGRDADLRARTASDIVW